MVEPADKGPLIGYGRTADIFTWGGDQVLKLLHESWPVDAVEEEARICRLVRDMGLPVPDVSGTIEDGGRFGMIYTSTLMGQQCYSGFKRRSRLTGTSDIRLAPDKKRGRYKRLRRRGRISI